MDFHKYQKLATKTFKGTPKITTEDLRVVNWALGVANEEGELAGEIKHNIFHLEPLDKMKIAKEIGDVLWYLSALCTSLELELTDCAELNLAKLEHRHGGSFSFEASAQRHEKEQKFEDTDEYRYWRGRLLGRNC